VAVCVGTGAEAVAGLSGAGVSAICTGERGIEDDVDRSVGVERLFGFDVARTALVCLMSEVPYRWQTSHFLYRETP